MVVENEKYGKSLVLLQYFFLAVMVVTAGTSKLALLSWRPALITLAFAVCVMAGIGLVSFLLLFRNMVQKKQLGRRNCILAATLSVLPLAVVLYFGVQGAGKPPIHDITTDTETPPQYIAAVNMRKPGDNSTDYAGEAIAKLQRQAYPKVESLIVEEGRAKVYSLCLSLLDDYGWEVISADQQSGRIEAVVESLFFGFKDDVVIRLQFENAGCRVDMRSSSRAGVSDLGVNAKRIESFLQALAEKV